ncbi:hypothetical protein GGX14DRAFT_574617 [Mycena pura]|uniref:F-box domain-containing protein n=1 Tax=Mycena pura TaxID=153505 RepID=A0AAD6V0S2_9AGAR|nr:hypothetical protein GGX14DRAFT_574617 [Mycena pura]
MMCEEKCSAACSSHCPAPPKDFQLPSSPCPELLITNSIPSDVQINQVHNFIRSAEAKISALDDVIAGVRHALDRLELQRAKLGDIVKSHRSMASTVRRLPSEILSKIFSHYYLEASDTHASPERLLHLVSVCDRWRTIVLASPLLWCHIIPKMWKVDSGEMQQTSLQLKRSAPAALSIHLSSLRSNSNSSRILDLLLTESRRWQNLHLNINPSDYTHLATSGGEFPILEKLFLVFREPVAEHAALFFGPLPALVDLTLKAYGTSISEAPDYLWAQLRTCTLIGCLMDDILRILPLFSAGARVCLDDCFAQKNVHPTSVHTVVSDLSLCCYWQVTDTLLGAFTAPCLKRLCIAGHYSIPSIIAFLKRSSCALTHLVMDLSGLQLLGPDRFAAPLPTLLRSPHARDIVDLEVDLHGGEIPEELMDALAMRDIVPNLRALAFQHVGLGWLNDETAASLLEIYANRRPIFQSLWLNGSRSLSPDAVHALKLGGLEVVMYSVEEEEE